MKYILWQVFLAFFYPSAAGGIPYAAVYHRMKIIRFQMPEIYFLTLKFSYFVA